MDILFLRHVKMTSKIDYDITLANLRKDIASAKAHIAGGIAKVPEIEAQDGLILAIETRAYCRIIMMLNEDNVTIYKEAQQLKDEATKLIDRFWRNFKVRLIAENEKSYTVQTDKQKPVVINKKQVSHSKGKLSQNIAREIREYMDTEINENGRNKVEVAKEVATIYNVHWMTIQKIWYNLIYKE